MIKFYELMSLGEVSRWNIVNRVKPQSVAEHSYLVTIVALELAKLMGWPVSANAPLAFACLFHDATEAVTGDIPTPAKRLINQGPGPKERNPISPPDRVGQIEAYLMPELPYWPGEELPESVERGHVAQIESLVKIADLIEAYHWISENGVGNRAKVVMMDVRGRLMDRVRSVTLHYDIDYFEPVNWVLTTLGLPFIHSEERVSP